MNGSCSSASSLMRSLVRLSSISNFHNSSSQSKNLRLLLRKPLILSFRYFGSGASNGERDSFTVSYLIEKCALSPEDAVSAAKSVSFNSPARPDSVMEFLKSHGFTQAEMSHVIGKLPVILSFNPERTLFPKLDFLRSKGFSKSGLRKVVFGSPWILARSLDRQIVPCYDFISSVIRSDKKTLSAIRRYPSLLVLGIEAEIMPMMKIFLDYGVPENNYGLFLSLHPRHIKTRPDRLKEIVGKVKGMGIDPSTVKFITAVQVLGQLSQSTWDKKLEAYSRCGWSEAMSLRAFVKYPRCMHVSESKIVPVMDYFIHEMGIESSYLSKHPSLLSLSLEKRIIPRCSVIKAMRSKGLAANSHFSLYAALCITEKNFLGKFVGRFPDHSPSLFNFYREKIDCEAQSE